MPEPFFDDREIGATGEKPRGMRVTQIMNPDLDSQVRGFERRHPDVLAEPPAGNMPIGVGDSRLPGSSLPAARVEPGRQQTLLCSGRTGSGPAL